MLKLFRNQKGFTLVELMIVVVIVGILAAVAIPMYTGSVKRAKASEAVAALGTIRSALRVYYAEHDSFLIGSSADIDIAKLDLTIGDLLGRYFDYSDYKYTRSSTWPKADSFYVVATGGTDPDDAPAAAEVDGIVRTIYQNGTITKTVP